MNILVFVALLNSFAGAKVFVCENFLLSTHETLSGLIVKAAGYPENRRLLHYREKFGMPFVTQLLTARFWIDSGGGLGLAQREAMGQHQLIRTLNITQTAFKTPGRIVLGHEDRLDKLLELIGRNEYENADLITDLYGAFSYSFRPDMVLQRFNEWLSSKGSALIYFDDLDTVDVGGLQLKLSDWIILRSGLNCKRHNPKLVECNKVADIRVPHLKMTTITETHPPVRTFKELATDELEPNLLLVVEDYNGAHAGNMTGHLSLDAEALYNMNFDILANRQKYHREIIDELMLRYPNLNEIHTPITPKVVRALGKYDFYETDPNILRRDFF